MNPLGVCLLCGRPLVFMTIGGWTHIIRRFNAEHTPRSDPALEVRVRR